MFWALKDSRQGKFKVELPGGDRRGPVALIVKERQADLDDFEQIYVAPQELVLVV